MTNLELRMPSHKQLQAVLETRDLYINRLIATEIEQLLGSIECVTLHGPRQIGKTTLAKSHFKQKLGAIYRDLEDSEDRAEIGTGRAFFERNKKCIIILDEIQECEFLFKNIKAFIDRQREVKNRSCRFLLFGSADLDVQKNAFSSLTGRVAQIQMSGILLTELIRAFDGIFPHDSEQEALLTCQKITELLMIRGQIPLSLCAGSELESSRTRKRFVETIVKKDIDHFDLNTDSSTLNRCFRFIARVNGQQVQLDTYTKQLKTNGVKVQAAIDALEQLLLIRAVEPWSPINGSSSRVSKHTKIYIRDSGLLLSQLSIRNLNALLNSRHLGSVWEGFVIESVIGTAINTGYYYNCSFYRTHKGDSELDLVLEFEDGETWGIEIKHSEPDNIKAGNIRAASEVGVDRRLVIHNGIRSYNLSGGFEAMPLHRALDEIMKKR